MQISSAPQKNAPKVGITFLSVKSVGGNIYIVDQNGDMINGLISCSVNTEVDCLTKISLTCVSHGEANDNSN